MELNKVNDIKGLITRLRKIKDSAEEIITEKIQLDKQRTAALIRSLSKYNIYNAFQSVFYSLKEQADSIIKSYSNTIPLFNALISKCGISTVQYMRTIKGEDNSFKALRSISLECEGLISLLYGFINPFDQNQISKLGFLKKELEKIENIKIKENLEKAILELESGHLLGGTLIASSVFTYMYSQIKGKTDEEKLNYLIEKGFIDKKKKEEKSWFHKACRQARNAYNHELKLPYAEEALSILSDTIKFAKLHSLFSKLKKQ